MKGKSDYSAFDGFKDHTKQAPVVDIQPGDFLVSLTDGIPFPRDSNSFPKIPTRAEREAEQKEKVKLCAPGHGMIANPTAGFADFNKPFPQKNIFYAQQIIHAKQNFFVTVEETRAEISHKDTLGTTIALRCVDPQIAAKIKEFSFIANKVTIPFIKTSKEEKRLMWRSMDAREGKPVTPQELSQLELFRAFRAFVRLSQEKPQPISKNKGVACSTFVSYIHKAAIIAKFFPDGLPPDLMKLYQDIEQSRTAVGKKLVNVDPAKMMQFEQKALSYLKEKQAEPIHVQELQRRVKSANIRDFTYNALQSPLWIAGIVCHDQGSEAIMSLDTYKKAWRLAEKADPTKPPRNLVNVKEVESASEPSASDAYHVK